MVRLKSIRKLCRHQSSRHIVCRRLTIMSIFCVCYINGNLVRLLLLSFCRCLYNVYSVHVYALCAYKNAYRRTSSTTTSQNKSISEIKTIDLMRIGDLVNLNICEELTKTIDKEILYCLYKQR